MITAKIIADSISPDNIRLTTMHLRYPRMVHADFMTHRVFSRNGRSSRAVPVLTLLAEDPYIPDFHYNKPGMQAAERLTDEDMREARKVWLAMAEACKEGVRKLAAIGGPKKGVHKQWANRPLEWFGYIDVLVTSTDWANFMHLRDHGDAQPEIQELAHKMHLAMANSTPEYLHHEGWHLPYADDTETFDLVADYVCGPKGGAGPREVDMMLDILKKLSAARCARISYKPFDGDGSIEKELERYARLVESQPVHASPVEHQATPDRLIDLGGMENDVWEQAHLHGNFRGWIQARKTIPNEAVW